MFNFTRLAFSLFAIALSQLLVSCGNCTLDSGKSVSRFSTASTKLVARDNYAKQLHKADWAVNSFVSPTASGKNFNANNALSLVRACRLVWEEDKSAIDAVAKHWGLEYHFVDLRSTHTQYLLLGNADFTILAYRATQGKFGDLMTVLKTARYVSKGPVFDQIPSGAGGFRTSVADSFSAGLVGDIKNFRRNTGATQSPFFITGHSLGGALAVLARHRLNEEGIKADSLYVFGCPISLRLEPGSPEYVSYKRDYADTNFFLRFYDDKRNWSPGDNVPRLNPRFFSEQYEPLGVSCQIHPDGRLTDYSKYKPLNAISSIGWAVPWLFEWLCTHNLDRSYIPAIREAAKIN